VVTRVVPADDAALGSGDPTRRWALADGQGVVRWPGLTRNEADALANVLSASGSVDPDAVLGQVELGVVLSDGAGPYLVDADGVLVLVVDAHPHLDGVAIAIANTATDRVRIGAVRPLAAPAGWEWVARAGCAAADRIGALDDLARTESLQGLQGWSRTWDGRGARPGIP
jgi:hypothetical protein